jgi:Family of unknown function (DUF6290)
MAVISIRLNNEEEKIVKYLESFYEEDKSALIKHSIKEMYEDVVDNKEIVKFEESERKKKAKFIESNEVLKSIK